MVDDGCRYSLSSGSRHRPMWRPRLRHRLSKSAEVEGRSGPSAVPATFEQIPVLVQLCGDVAEGGLAEIARLELRCPISAARTSSALAARIVVERSRRSAATVPRRRAGRTPHRARGQRGGSAAATANSPSTRPAKPCSVEIAARSVSCSAARQRALGTAGRRHRRSRCSNRTRMRLRNSVAAASVNVMAAMSASGHALVEARG